MHEEIITAHQLQATLSDLQKQLNQFTQPKLTDYRLLPDIYQVVKNELVDNHNARYIRLHYVFIVIYLYSPKSLLDKRVIKSGLRGAIGLVIGRCKQEVSAIFQEAKFRNQQLAGFREQSDKLFTAIEKYLKNNLYNNN